MSPAAALTRLAGMDSQELRFRLTCEARKVAGRLRHAVRHSRVDRRRLARILDPGSGPLVARAIVHARRGEYLAAHEALAAHVASRPSCWPINPSRRGPLVEELRHAYPETAAEARSRAQRLLRGRHDFLGYTDIQLADPPDWHGDVIHGRRAPMAHWTRIPYLDAQLGDHKVIWEINRHQYWLALGSAYWLTGDGRYRGLMIAHLEDWLARNPAFIGINWASMLELAFRALSWTWTVEFFGAEAAGDTVPWLVDLFVSLDCQLTHVSHNLSRYFSPNTHLSGEALALYTVSAAFPELRGSASRLAEGRAVLVREATRQVHPDGGHVELSAHYHRYTTDFYLLALMVARASGDPAAAPFEEVSRRLALFLRTLADNRGVLPSIGDDDGGQLFGFSGRASCDASATLSAAAALLNEPTLAVGPAPADTAWILGRRPESATPPSRCPSRAFPDSGYFVSRDGSGNQLIFDAGRHGFLNGGHAHADALSVAIHAGGEPLLVDPGTATYVMDPEARDRFRSFRMHNTVVLNATEPAFPDGPFRWRTRTDGQMLLARIGAGLDFFVGTHDGYLPLRHVRAVLSLHGRGWLIVDRITGAGSVSAAAWWHLHPSWQPVLRDRVVSLRSSAERCLAVATTTSIEIVSAPEWCAYAPAYGRVERAATLRCERTAEAPLTIGTFVAATASMADALSIVELPERQEEGWFYSRFGVSTRSGDLTIEVPLPIDGGARPSAAEWPQPCMEQLLSPCVE